MSLFFSLDECMKYTCVISFTSNLFNCIIFIFWKKKSIKTENISRRQTSFVQQGSATKSISF